MSLKEMVVVIFIMGALAMGAIPLFHYFHDLGEQRRAESSMAPIK